MVTRTIEVDFIVLVDGNHTSLSVHSGVAKMMYVDMANSVIIGRAT